jgi:hypothetical protein
MLEARGWPHQDRCALCDQEPEMAYHIFINCPYAKIVWQGLAQRNTTVSSIAQGSTTLHGWWKKIARFHKSKTKRDYTTLAAIAVWHLWKERNRRVFENYTCTTDGLVVQIRADLKGT